MKEMDIVIDIDKCRNNTRIEEFRRPDELGDVEKSARNVGAISPKKEKRVSVSGKPPRPPGPRGLSLDAADQKLIKEISELLMIKRARIERIRKTKAAAKPSSSSAGNFIAMLFTIIFCVVIVFQGCHSWRIWPRNHSPIGIPTNEHAYGVVVQDSAIGSLNLMGMVPRSDDDKATH